jgi:nucleoside-diphosphate-sugar epimerase
MSPYSYETTAEEVANDLKSQIAGKTILVTGVSPKGLGAAFAEIIAQYGPECIILATRDLSKAEETGQAIKATSPSVRTHSVELDLASLDQVRKAAAKIQSFGEKIDVIVNNAAIMASPYFKTVDGIEGQFAVNYLGHFLLTNLLLPDMLARNVPIRIVNVSSNGCRYGPVRFGDLDFSVSEIWLDISNGMANQEKCGRMGNIITDGFLTASPSLPACFTPKRWWKSSVIDMCMLSVCIQV